MKIRGFGGSIVAGVVVFGVCSAFAASPITYNTVSALDPNNNGTIMNISDASSYTDQVLLANFTTLVSNAWNADLGGVYNFETAQIVGTNPGANATIGDTAADALSGLFGTSLSKTFQFYRSDASSTSSAALDYNTNQGQILASGASAGGYLGIQGVASYSLTFLPPSGYGLVDFGITDIARDASGNTSSGAFTAHFSDGSTVTSTTANVTSTTTNPGTGVFFGFQAPTGLTITSVDWANSNSTSRFDDVAFVLAAPEPASLALLGLGGAALAIAVRRRLR